MIKEELKRECPKSERCRAYREEETAYLDYHDGWDQCDTLWLTGCTCDSSHVFKRSRLISSDARRRVDTSPTLGLRIKFRNFWKMEEVATWNYCENKVRCFTWLLRYIMIMSRTYDMLGYLWSFVRQGKWHEEPWDYTCADFSAFENGVLKNLSLRKKLESNDHCMIVLFRLYFYTTYVE